MSPIYLVDTNIFLEIFLCQANQENCRKFLQENKDTYCISDFALHSIGVILFRSNGEECFQRFLSEMLGKMRIVTLSKRGYLSLAAARTQWKLDFDDAYQFTVAKEYGLTLVTQDKHFVSVEKEISLLFLSPVVSQ